MFHEVQQIEQIFCQNSHKNKYVFMTVFAGTEHFESETVQTLCRTHLEYFNQVLLAPKFASQRARTDQIPFSHRLLACTQTTRKMRVCDLRLRPNYILNYLCVARRALRTAVLALSLAVLMAVMLCLFYVLDMLVHISRVHAIV